MKKSIIALTLCMLMALSGCSGKENNTAENNDIYDDSRIVSLISEEGTYTDTDGNECSYSFNVPQLDAEEDNAKLINDDIAYLFGTMVEKQLAKVDTGEYMDYSYVSWESHWNDSVLSLVITANDMEDGAYFGVYNYDFATDSLLTTRDLTYLADFSYDYLTTSIEYTVVNYFDETFAEYWSNYATADSYDPYYMECRAAGISDEKLDEDLDRLYLNDDGELMCIAELGCMAGSGWMFADIPVNAYVDPSGACFITDICNDFVTATIESNGSTVTVYLANDGEYVDAVQNADLLDNYYTVQGTYSQYTGGFIGNIGDTFNPYLFLITSNGGIEYVNILESLNCFGQLYCGGPLCQVSDIVSIYDGPTEAEGSLPSTVLAADSQGNEYDLSGLVYAAENTYNYGIISEWSTNDNVQKTLGDAPATHMNIIISQEDGFALGYYNFDNNTSEEYFGKMIVLGMSREGVIYGISVTGEEGTINSVVALDNLYVDDSDTLLVKTIAGTNIFGDSGLTEVELTRTFG